MLLSKKFFAVSFISSIFILSAVSHSATAGGVDLQLYYGSRYVSTGGNAVSMPADAYMIFYNPAGLAAVEKPDLAVSSMNMMFNYGAPIGADNAQRKSEISWGPYFFLGGAYPVNDWMTAGLAIFPTAAQGGKFANVDFGDGITDKSYSNMLVRIEIAPTLAVRLHKFFSIGASWRIGYTRFDKKVGTFYPQDGTITMADGQAYLDSSLSAWDAQGLKIGTYIDNIPNLKAGLTFRFENPIELNGTTKLTSPLLSATETPISTTQDVTLPAQIQAGFTYEWLPDTFLTTFTYEYTMSSSLQYDAPVLDQSNATVVAAGGLLGPAATKTPLEYRNSSTYHFGGEYTFRLGAQRKLRTGLGMAIDQSTTRNKNPNPVLPPSAHYIGYAGGVTYEWAKQSLGLALNYGEYESRTSTTELNTALSTARSAFAGKYSLAVFVAQLDYKMSF